MSDDWRVGPCKARTCTTTRGPACGAPPPPDAAARPRGPLAPSRPSPSPPPPPLPASSPLPWTLNAVSSASLRRCQASQTKPMEFTQLLYFHAVNAGSPAHRSRAQWLTSSTSGQVLRQKPMASATAAHTSAPSRPPRAAAPGAWRPPPPRQPPCAAPRPRGAPARRSPPARAAPGRPALPGDRAPPARGPEHSVLAWHAAMMRPRMVTSRRRPASYTALLEAACQIEHDKRFSGLVLSRACRSSESLQITASCSLTGPTATSHSQQASRQHGHGLSSECSPHVQARASCLL